MPLKRISKFLYPVFQAPKVKEPKERLSFREQVERGDITAGHHTEWFLHNGLYTTPKEADLKRREADLKSVEAFITGHIKGDYDSRITTLKDENGINFKVLRIRHQDDDLRPSNIYLHGKSGGVDFFKNQAVYDFANGADLVLVTLAGYHGNDGKPSQRNFIHNFNKVLETLKDEGIPVDQIAIDAYSMGCDTALNTLHYRDEYKENHGYSRLRLRAPFDTLANMVSHTIDTKPYFIMHKITGDWDKWLSRNFLHCGEVAPKLQNTQEIQTVMSPDDGKIPNTFTIGLHSEIDNPNKSIIRVTGDHYAVGKHIMDVNGQIIEPNTIL